MTTSIERAGGAGEGSAGAIEEKLGDLAAAAGLQRIHIVAWRDLDDPEAGGSELHASTIARAWAAAGIEVTVRTSSFEPGPVIVTRDGYRVVRKSGRYLAFARTALSGGLNRAGPRDALVEIWNGMPFFSPLWARCPRVVFLHHVHAEMWRMVLPPRLARLGEVIEFRLAPPVYRRTPVVTLSESSRHEIVDRLGLAPANVSVVAPGVDPRFVPLPANRSTDPLVVAVGRLVPVKRFGLLIDALVQLRNRHPRLRAVIVGEGYERPALEAQIRASGAGDWLALPGRLSDDELVELYQRAWVVASSSAREGWGMTLTEAGACGTPAVATDIAGHRDAVVPGVTGLLSARAGDLAADLDAVLSGPALRRRLGEAARRRAAGLSWDATALGTLRVVAAAAGAWRAR
ncbi:MAG TPA: glycosyltransferase family 4 protein [Acidimicrobiales bacterium]|nr:glycosyltransferase family 4 protein [Acidimicrobiales bacterium]